MSKSKHFRSLKKPLKVGFSLQKGESHQRSREITDYKVKTSIPGPSFMHEGYCPRKCTSLLAPRTLRADSEYKKSGSESEESPVMNEQSQVKPSESSYKTTEKSEESPFILPGSSISHKGFVSSKCTISSTAGCSASSRKSGHFSEPPKNTFPSQAKPTKTPCKAAEKSEKAPGPEKRRNISRKGSSSPTPRNRIIGGGSRAPSPFSESSKIKNLSLAKLTKTLCKAAGKPENQLENCRKSMREPLKSSCSDARSSRRGSCVSFYEPVAAEIPYCETDPPKPACKKCSCSKTYHPTPVTTWEQKPLKNQSPKSYGKYKRHSIVVPFGEGCQRDHKKQSNHRTWSSFSLQNPVHASQQPQSSSSKLKSYIPYSRSSFHVDSLNNLQVVLSGCQRPDSSPSVRQCATKSTSCTDCSDISQQIRKLVQKIDCLEATVLQISEEKREKNEYPKREEDESPKLERILSSCDFCRGRNLPILNCFKRQLKEAIGCRSCTEVVISIFLRADNIYHVNLRDLKSGCSLACFLVTDDAIMDVQKMGLFREILTFCVIDVRNTLKPKNCALGITFELIDPERQKGGCDTINHGLCLTCKPFLARVLNQPLHRLRHVYTDPAITSDYIKKSLKGKFSST